MKWGAHRSGTELVAAQAHNGFFANLQLFADVQQGDQGLQCVHWAAQSGAADQATQGQFLVLGARVPLNVVPLQVPCVELAALCVVQWVLWDG